MTTDTDTPLEQLRTSDRVAEAGATLTVVGWVLLVVTGQLDLVSIQSAVVMTALSVLGLSSERILRLLRRGGLTDE